MGSDSKNPRIVHFVDCVLDLDTAELRRNGTKITLQDQPFQILTTLLENPGRLVTREELIKRLWPAGTFVDFDQSLNKAIARLREALGDNAERPTVVETLPRKGYRFIASLRQTQQELAIRPDATTPSSDENPADVSMKLAPRNGEATATPASMRLAQRGNLSLRIGVPLVLLGTIVVGVYVYLVRSPAPFERIEVTQVTGNGKVKTTAISPDGKYVGYVVDEGSANPFFGLGGGGKESLWIRQVAGGNDVQVVPPSDVAYKRLAFSNDGGFLYAIRSSQASGSNSIYKVPLLGGTEKRLVADVDDGLTFSPDGKRMAYVRLFKPAHSGVVVANEDGNGERILAECKSPPYYCATGISWSPDGKTIATNAFWGESGAGRMSPLVFSVQSGAEHSFTNRRWAWVGNLAWLRDGRGLIVNAMDIGGTHQQIAFLSYPDGQLRRITTDTNEYLGISVTADSRILASVQEKLAFDAWIAPLADATSAKPITSGVNLAETTWSSDGKIVFEKIAGPGEMNIWVMNSDGSGEKQLTANAGRINVLPRVSPDGRYIVFVSERTGTAHLWRMDMDGSNPTQLTNNSEDYPWFGCAFTPDAKWVVFTRIGADGGLWKVSIDGGEQIRMNTSLVAYYPAVSPDGKMVAYYSEDSSDRKGAEVMSLDGNNSKKRFDIPIGNIRWTSDGRSLLYVKNESGVSNLWSQPISGDTARQITHFNNLLIGNFDTSRDGKNLVMSRGTVNRDVVLIRDLK